MGEKLKLSAKEIESLILDLDSHEEAYKKYLQIKQNSLTICWLVFLTLPAVIGFFYPDLENFLLIGLIAGSILGLKIMPRINLFFINIYLKKINKVFGHQILSYIKYHKIIRKNISQTLKEGSEGNYLQKVIIKTLAQVE